MYPVSNTFDEYLAKRERKWLTKVEINDIAYGMDSVVEFDVENDLTLDESFQPGTAILSKLTLQLKTTNVIPSNAKVVPYVALQLPEDMDGANVAWESAEDTWDEADYPWIGAQTEWIPLGEFYIDGRDKIRDAWEFVCYDKLVFADVPYISALNYPATMQGVWDEICTSLGYVYDSTVVIDPSYTIPVGPAGYSKRKVLGYIAGANGASVYVGKDGIIRFCAFHKNDIPVMDFSDSEYFTLEQTNPLKTYTRVEVIYDTQDELSYEAGTGTENQTLRYENPFVTQDIVDDLLVRFNGFTYLPVQMPIRAYPQLEAGDRVSIDGDEETMALHTVFRFRGGLSMEIEAFSISEQKSEFVVDGSIQAQIDYINRTAVRTDKSYYGVSVNREVGFLVEREDRFARSIWNADEFKMQVGDGLGSYTDSLYFDTVLKQYAFIGKIIATEGEFTGKITATSGSIGGWDIESDRLSGDGILEGGHIIGSEITIGDNFYVDEDGILIAEGAFIQGAITMGPGSVIQWDYVDSDPAIDDVHDIAVAIANGNYSGGTFIDGQIIYAPQIFGGVITGGSITSNSSITVTTDIYLGNSLFLTQGVGSSQVIASANGGNILFSGGSMHLNPTVSLIVSTPMLTGSIAIQGLGSRLETPAITLSGTDLAALLNTKIAKGGPRVISHINATATGLVIWFEDNSNETILYD